MNSTLKIFIPIALALLTTLSASAQKKYNVLFVISDDLTATALGCYGNTVCKTPNIDALATEGTRYTRTYCQYPVCGPSRASFMFGYYPHTRDVFGYVSGRSQNGDRETWAEHFKNRGYYTARVSKIFHMGVPGGIESGGNGADDAQSWTERFNSQGPEVFADVHADGIAERLENATDGNRALVGGNTYEYVMAAGDDLVHSDGKTAQKACELIALHKNEPFFLAVGFVRPHIPFAAPKSYFDMYPWQNMVLPVVPAGDQSDIHGFSVTSNSQGFDDTEKKKSIAGYYAAVSFMDAQVGKVLNKLKSEGLEDDTIVIFTSDHGFFLGEHDFWSKSYVHEESSRVPMIIKVPGKAPAVCDSFAELLDLFPTTVDLCGSPVPTRLQGKSLAVTLDDPNAEVREASFTIYGSNSRYYLRDANYAFIQYKADGSNGYELYDMVSDPYQITNLETNPAYTSVLNAYKVKMAQKIVEVEYHEDDHSLWLPLNDNSGVTALDANGVNRGDLVNFVDSSSHWVTGKHNKACVFDGVDDYITLPEFSAPVGIQHRTVSSWIKTTAEGVISTWGSSVQDGGDWHFNVTGDGKLRLSVGAGSITSQSSVTDGQWHHVAAVLNNDGTPNVDEVKLYVDGQLEINTTSVSQPINTAASDVIIGHPSLGLSEPIEINFPIDQAVSGSADYVITSSGVTMTVVPTSTTTNPDTIGISPDGSDGLGVTGGADGSKADRTVDQDESLIFTFDQPVLLRALNKGNAGGSETSILTSTAFDGLSGVVIGDQGGTYNDATNSINANGPHTITIDDANSADGILIPMGTSMVFTVGSGDTISFRGITVATLGGEVISPGEGSPFNGSIDEYRIDSRALDTAEISEQYQTTSSAEDAWKLLNYGATSGFDWSQDTDGDGYIALEEYAYGSSPHELNALKNKLTPEFNSLTNKLEVTFPRRRTGTHNILYEVQFSKDLKTWTQAFSEKSVMNHSTLDPDFFEDVTVSSEATSSEEPNMFMRLNVKE